MTYFDVSFVMRKNRFEALFRNIHFVDNLDVNQEKKIDRLWEWRPWVNSLRENFLKVSSEEYHAVDEIMLLFKVKSLLRKYMPKKLRRMGRGFKLRRREVFPVFFMTWTFIKAEEIKHLLLIKIWLRNQFKCCCWLMFGITW